MNIILPTARDEDDVVLPPLPPARVHLSARAPHICTASAAVGAVVIVFVVVTTISYVSASLFPSHARSIASSCS